MPPSTPTSPATSTGSLHIDSIGSKDPLDPGRINDLLRELRHLQKDIQDNCDRARSKYAKDGEAILKELDATSDSETAAASASAAEAEEKADGSEPGKGQSSSALTEAEKALRVMKNECLWFLQHHHKAWKSTIDLLDRSLQAIDEQRQESGNDAKTAEVKADLEKRARGWRATDDDVQKKCEEAENLLKDLEKRLQASITSRRQASKGESNVESEEAEDESTEDEGQEETQTERRSRLPERKGKP